MGDGAWVSVRRRAAAALVAQMARAAMTSRVWRIADQIPAFRRVRYLPGLGP